MSRITSRFAKQTLLSVFRPQKDPYNKAQSLKTWHGKVLRIDVSRSESLPRSTRQYDIPPSNPFLSLGTNARPEIYAYGFRNPVSIRRGYMYKMSMCNTFDLVPVFASGD